MNTPTVSVRPAHFGDARALFELIRSFPDQLVPRSPSDIVQNIDRFLVGLVDERIAGCVSWAVLPEPGSVRHPSIEIKSLAVQPEVQGSGLGRALMQAVLDRVRQWEPEQIIALTFEPDFFRKFGFEEVPKETLMHKIYTGCMNCTRYESPFTCPEIAMRLTLPS